MTIRQIIEARRHANKVKKEKKTLPKRQEGNENPRLTAHKVVSVKANKVKIDRKAVKADRKAEKRKEKDDKRETKHAPREKLWSETHPEGWHKARGVLPRLHMIAFALILAYLTVMELINGNNDFLMDWYRDTWILPAFFEVTSSEYMLQLWWQQYGQQFLVILIFIIMCFVMFYMLVWRTCFRSYVKYSEGEPKPEGRCYWRTNNMWTRLWDRLYRSPQRTMNTYWINQGLFFNIFNPNASLVRLDTGTDEICEEKGLWKMWVHEKRIRRKVNNSSRWLTTADYLYKNEVIPTEYAEERFLAMGKKCVDDTKKLTHANPDVRIDVVKSGTSLVIPEWKEAVMNARKKRAEREQAER